MFRVEQQIYVWQGNYYSPAQEGYEWNDINKEFESEAQAIAYILQVMANPFAYKHRIVHNGKIVAIYSRWAGKIEREVA